MRDSEWESAVFNLDPSGKLSKMRFRSRVDSSIGTEVMKEEVKVPPWPSVAREHRCSGSAEQRLPRKSLVPFFSEMRLSLCYPG